MTLLQTFFWQASNYCRTLKRKHFSLKSVFAEVRKTGLQGCSVREKESVSQNITGAWGKNVSKKTAGSSGAKELFLKTKKVIIKIRNISHLLSCKLPRKFFSWVSRKTKMPNCVDSFAAYQTSWRQPWKHLHY